MLPQQANHVVGIHADPRACWRTHLANAFSTRVPAARQYYAISGMPHLHLAPCRPRSWPTTTCALITSTAMEVADSRQQRAGRQQHLQLPAAAQLERGAHQLDPVFHLAAPWLPLPWLQGNHRWAAQPLSPDAAALPLAVAQLQAAVPSKQADPAWSVEPPVHRSGARQRTQAKLYAMPAACACRAPRRPLVPAASGPSRRSAA